MSHVPPYRALEAFHVGRLRESHRALLERHLLGCEACRLALATIGAYERLSGEVRGTEPRIDWNRVDAHVARRIGRKQRDRRIVLVAAATLALAASALLATFPRPQRATPRLAGVTRSAGPSPALAEVSGDVSVDGARVDPLRARPARLREGAVLRTQQGTLRVALASGTGFELGPHAELTVASTRDPYRLLLGSGRVFSEVRPGTQYEVVAGAYVIRVRGTRFHVERSGEHVSVHLHAGRVEVVEHGVSLGTLVAPATWTSPDAAAPAPEPARREAARTRAAEAIAATEAPAPPEAPPFVSSDEMDVAAAFRAQSQGLKRCIASDAARISITIHLSVGTMGTIRDVSLSSRAEVPTDVSDCILRGVQRLRMPAPDDPVDISLPMTLP